MCIAMPGTVLSVDETIATVDFSGNILRAQAGLLTVKPGDAVLVHAGCIIQVLSDFDRDMLLEVIEAAENA